MHYDIFKMLLPKESALELNETSVDQLPIAKKKKYASTFKQKWLKNYPFISRSRKDDGSVKYCSCWIDINAARGGKPI